jgi:hypothetical protein
MARGGGTDPTTLIALGVIGFAGYRYALAGGLGTGLKGSAQRLQTRLQQYRRAGGQSIYQLHDDGQCWQDTPGPNNTWSSVGPVPLKYCKSGVPGSAQPQAPAQVPQNGAPATTAGDPAPAAPAGATFVREYAELHDDGWYLVDQYSDNTYRFTAIDPDHYAAYNIPQPNTPPAPAPDPVASNNYDINQGNPTVDPNGSNAVVQSSSNGNGMTPAQSFGA